jgi:hypothetical protein
MASAAVASAMSANDADARQRDRIIELKTKAR